MTAIEKRKLQLEKADNPEVYVDLINSCRKKNPFDCVFVQHSLRSDGTLKPGDRIIQVKNFKGWIDPNVKNSVPRIFKTRFVLSETGSRIMARESMNGECSELPLYKVGMNRKIGGNPKLAYGTSFLAIKPKKHAFVTKLLKLVTSGDVEFYNRTLINPISVATPGRADTGVEEEAIESDTDVYE